MSPNLAVGVLQLSLEEHIQSLKKELFALCACEPAPGFRTQAQKACNPNPVTDTLTAPKQSTPALAPALVQPPVPALQHPTPTSTMPEENHDDNKLPVHPFSRAKDAMYAPPITNNITVKQKPPPLKKPDVPLRTAALIYDPQVASTMYAWTMDSQITITQCKLLLLSLEVRNKV